MRLKNNEYGKFDGLIHFFEIKNIKVLLLLNQLKFIFTILEKLLILLSDKYNTKLMR